MSIRSSDENKTKMLRPRPRTRPTKQQQDYITKKLFCCNTHFCHAMRNFVIKK